MKIKLFLFALMVLFFPIMVSASTNATPYLSGYTCSSIGAIWPDPYRNIYLTETEAVAVLYGPTTTNEVHMYVSLISNNTVFYTYPLKLENGTHTLINGYILIEETGERIAFGNIGLSFQSLCEPSVFLPYVERSHVVFP